MRESENSKSYEYYNLTIELYTGSHVRVNRIICFDA